MTDRMHFEIGDITGRRGMDILMEIINRRDDFIMALGYPPKKITMARDTFASLIPRLDSMDYVYRRWNDETGSIDYKIMDMDIEII